MSYISILLPAFFCHDTELEKIKRDFTQKQFLKSIDEIDLIKVNQEPLEYAIRFHNTDLSLEKLEDLINQRNNMKIILEKTYESMNILMNKYNENDPNLKPISKTPTSKSNFKIDLSSHISNNKIIEDNYKLKDILKKQLEQSENFRVNTEQILNSLKEEFNFLVLEIENMRKTKKIKNSTDRHQIIGNEIKRPGVTNIYEFEIDENDSNIINIPNTNISSQTNTYYKKLNTNLNSNGTINK